MSAFLTAGEAFRLRALLIQARYGETSPFDLAHGDPDLVEGSPGRQALSRAPYPASWLP